jgi:hypothetical protein
VSRDWVPLPARLQQLDDMRMCNPCVCAIYISGHPSARERFTVQSHKNKPSVRDPRSITTSICARILLLHKHRRRRALGVLERGTRMSSTSGIALQWASTIGAFKLFNVFAALLVTAAVTVLLLPRRRRFRGALPSPPAPLRWLVGHVLPYLAHERTGYRWFKTLHDKVGQSKRPLPGRRHPRTSGCAPAPARGGASPPQCNCR